MGLPTQKQWVEGCLSLYSETGFYPGDGQRWEEAHYPIPEWAGGTETVFLTWEHHQVHGLLQSLEFTEKPCFFAGDVKRFLNSGFCWWWFDLCQVFSDSMKEVAKKLNSHPNSSSHKSETGKKNVWVMVKHPNTSAARLKNAKAMNSHSNTTRVRKENAEKMLSHPNTLDRRLRGKKPVLCVETGVSYPSIREAAVLSGVNRTSICRSLKNSRPVSGLTWILLEKQ